MTASTQLLTTEQTAAILQLHPGTLENLRMKGQGPAYVKLGDRPRSPIRYRREDIEAWMVKYHAGSVAKS